MVSARRRAFTLIELLIALAVVAVLVGLVLAVVPLVRRAAETSTARAIVAQCALAAERLAAERGATPSPGLHPVAASAAPRLAFRAADGSARTLTGEALRALDPSSVDPAERARLLAADDRLADPAFATLYGLRRDELTVLGGRSGLERYRQLPALAAWNDRDDDGLLDRPYDATRYADATHLQQTPGGVDDLAARSRTLVDLVLAGAKEELGRLNALVETTGGTPVLADRLLAVGSTGPRPGPARFRAADGNWQPYRLRGLAVVDPWGGEVLAIATHGGLAFRSAGPDGHFVWHPGDDGVVTTAPDAADPSGDDRDARADNLDSRDG